MLNGLDLFSGIGGISYALRDYVRPVAYCEIDCYCQGVLLSNMSSGTLEKSPIWDDIKSLSGYQFGGIVDIIYGGFPCQDISVAGHGKGLAGERSGLFYEILRLCREIKPRFIFLENVPAITTRGGWEVVSSLAEMGYDCRWCVISAASIGALHRRERWFLLGYSKHNGHVTAENGRTDREESISGQQHKQKKEIGKPSRTDNLSRDVAYFCISDSIASQQTNPSSIAEQTEGRTRRRSSGQCGPFESREHWQEVVSGVCRVSDGVPFHVERLRALGNSVVPQQVKEAFEILMGLKKPLLPPAYF